MRTKRNTTGNPNTKMTEHPKSFERPMGGALQQQKALVKQMMEGGISLPLFVSLYAEELETQKKDISEKLKEATTCLMSMLIDPNDVKQLEGFEEGRIQRALYFLNNSRLFPMKELNEKYQYDPEWGEKESGYKWKNK